MLRKTADGSCCGLRSHSAIQGAFRVKGLRCLGWLLNTKYSLFFNDLVISIDFQP